MSTWHGWPSTSRNTVSTSTLPALVIALLRCLVVLLCAGGRAGKYGDQTEAGGSCVRFPRLGKTRIVDYGVGSGSRRHCMGSRSTDDTA